MKLNCMNILFVGVLDVSWSLNIPLMREFEKEGHKVVPFNYITIAEKYAGDTRRYQFLLREKLGRLLRKPFMPDKLKRYYCKTNGRYQMNQDLLTEVKKGSYDLVFLSKAGKIDWEIISEINKKTRTWYWFVDPIETAMEMNAKNYVQRCTWCSATFSNVTDFFKKYNKNSYFITQGSDPSLSINEENSTKEIDVIFVGSKDNKRKRYIEYLKKNRVGVIWFGPGADNPPIYLDELFQKYKKSKLILNFTRDKHGFSARVFKAMGLGSMVLTEYCEDIGKIFEKGKHLDWFFTKEECLEKIQFYLKNNDLRERIAASGAEYVQSNFSWSKIIDRILEVINTQ